MHTVFLLCRSPEQSLDYRAAFEGATDLRVVGVASKARSAWSMLSQCNPDLLVTDLRLMDGEALPLVQRLHQASLVQRPLVLAVGAPADEALLLDTLRAGAHSHLNDDEHLGSCLVLRVRQMLRGESEMAAPIARAVLNELDVNVQHGEAPLSSPERNVLRMLTDGVSVPDIALHMLCSQHTVRCHIRAAHRHLHRAAQPGASALRAA
jgi:DNA-binding NarL/FixJ family response regulator